MSEKTMNEPLGGHEIREIILQEIEKRLKGDCNLGDDLSYAGFKAKFDIRISFLRSIVKETLVWGAVGQVPEAGTYEVGVDVAIADTHTSASSPDIERQAHDLAIPVMVATPAGPVRRKVHVERVKRDV